MHDQIRVPFRKSSRSGDAGACVEVADLDSGGRAVRDSKDPIGPVLTCGPVQWVAFTAAISRGQVG